MGRKRNTNSPEPKREPATRTIGFEGDKIDILTANALAQAKGITTSRMTKQAVIAYVGEDTWNKTRSFFAQIGEHFHGNNDAPDGKPTPNGGLPDESDAAPV